MIGYERSPSYDGSIVEICRWIGKPWRRIELLSNEYWHKGEMVERTWDLSFSIGLRRIGVFFHWNISRSRGFDYSDEPHQ